jgi:hypothetical protein
MTLTQTLQIKERFLQYQDMQALDYCERRWKEEGCPTERWQVINFLEKMLHELKDHGGYPKVLLFRKKQIQRQEFRIQQFGETPAKGCACFGGYLLNGTPCPCPKGNPHRERLAKWGMKL